jgi:hypothetical protein
LYVLNMQGDDQYFENDHGRRFVDRGRELFPRTSWGSMGVKVFDVDNDGLQDIFVTDMHSDMSHEVGFDQEKSKSDMEWPAAFRGDGGVDRGAGGRAASRRATDGIAHEVADRRLAHIRQIAGGDQGAVRRPPPAHRKRFATSPASQGGKFQALS